jgi:hypothetical protein
MTRSALPSLTLTTSPGAGAGIKARTVGLLARLWQDDCGALLATELLLILTVLVIGVLVGLVAIRQGVITEGIDVSHAITALDTSYGFTGQRVGCDVRGDGLRDGRPDRVAEDGRTTRDGAVLPARDAVVDQGVRVGALEPGARGTAREQGHDWDGVWHGAWHRGGTQGFTAGSSFISGRHFEGQNGLAAGSVEPSVSTSKTKACD